MSEETTKIFVGGSELYVQMSFEQAQRFVEAGGPGFINTVGGGRAWINRNAVAAVVAEPAKINAEVEAEQPTRLAIVLRRAFGADRRAIDTSAAAHT